MFSKICVVLFVVFTCVLAAPSHSIEKRSHCNIQNGLLKTLNMMEEEIIARSDISEKRDAIVDINEEINTFGTATEFACADTIIEVFDEETSYMNFYLRECIEVELDELNYDIEDYLCEYMDVIDDNFSQNLSCGGLLGSLLCLVGSILDLVTGLLSLLSLGVPNELDEEVKDLAIIIRWCTDEAIKYYTAMGVELLKEVNNCW